MAQFDLQRLEKGSIPFQSKLLKTDGGEIIFYVHIPSPAESAVALDLGGCAINEKGEFQAPAISGLKKRTVDILEASKSKVPLAKLCIDNVEGLDGWPEHPKRTISKGIRILTDEAESKLVFRQLEEQGEDPYILLNEIAEFIQSQAMLREDEKKPSEQQSSGHTSQSEKSLETTVRSAKEDTGQN